MAGASKGPRGAAPRSAARVLAYRRIVDIIERENVRLDRLATSIARREAEAQRLSRRINELVAVATLLEPSRPS